MLNIFKTSTGKSLAGREIFITDIIYHKRYGKMQVRDVIANPNCLLLCRYPRDTLDRQFIEEIESLSWTPF